MFSSSRLRDAGVAGCAAVALAAAFPKLGAAWLVPFAAAAQFWVWQGASWKWAALLGWFSGIIFFAIGFSWIGHTVGGYIGIFGPFSHVRPGVHRGTVLRTRRRAGRDSLSAHAARAGTARRRRQRSPSRSGSARSDSSAHRSTSSGTRKPIRRCARSRPTAAPTGLRSFSASSERILPTRSIAVTCDR